jgi:hypothetical protein
LIGKPQADARKDSYDKAGSLTEVVDNVRRPPLQVVRSIRACFDLNSNRAGVTTKGAGLPR